MVRNLIIGGMPRSGKTRLTRRISYEQRLSHLSLDCQVRAFDKVFPQLLISNDAPTYAGMCDSLKPYLFEQMHWLGRFKIPFILDAYYLRPTDLKDLTVEGGFGAVYLGYPNISPEQKLVHVRASEIDSDWTKDMTDDQVLSDMSRFIISSNRMKKWCEESGITFIDVSFNWEVQIEKAYQLLVNMLDEKHA